VISYIRTHIETRILAVNSAAKQWDDAFNFENIPHNNIDNYYHVIYQLESDSPANANWVQENLSATITIFKRGGKLSRQALDDLMDDAHAIKLRLINPNHHINQIEKVDVDSVTPEPINSNDDIVRVTIQARYMLINNLIWES
jgi:hypothetical protein